MVSLPSWERGLKGVKLGGDNDGNYDAVLLVDTYTGWAPIVWGNGGKEGNKESEFYKRFGVKLKIIQMDDGDRQRNTTYGFERHG